MQLTMSLRFSHLLKVVVTVGRHGDAVMVLERFSRELVWLSEVMLLYNRLHHVVDVVVVVKVVVVDDDDNL